jgi:hypothetical protein
LEKLESTVSPLVLAIVPSDWRLPSSANTALSAPVSLAHPTRRPVEIATAPAETGCYLRKGSVRHKASFNSVLGGVQPCAKRVAAQVPVAARTYRRKANATDFKGRNSYRLDAETVRIAN